MSVKKDERTFREKQKVFEYTCKCYRAAENRLLLASDDSYLYTSQLRKMNDYEFLIEFNRCLLLCSDASAECLRMCYVYPELREQYVSVRSRSSIYRMCRKAIDEIVDCLGI